MEKGDLCGRVETGGRGNVGLNWKGRLRMAMCHGVKGQLKQMIPESQPRVSSFFLLWK